MTAQSKHGQLVAVDANSPSHRLAYWVSHILVPPILILIGAIYAANHVGTVAAWRWSILFLGMGVLVPSLYVVYLLQTGQISDLHMNKREERIQPTLLTVALSTAVIGLMLWREAPQIIMILGLAHILQTLIFLFITFIWKISAHSASAASLSTLLIMFGGLAALPCLLLIPLVAWSRVKLKRHTPAEVLLGAVLGSLFMGISWLVLGGI